MMKLLITGAFGNLGLVCLERAIDKGFSVVAVDIPSKQNKRLASKYKNQCKIVLTDYKTSEWLQNNLLNLHAIIHLAAILPPVTESNPALAKSVNIDLTASIINTFKLIESPPVFISPSSVTVFGHSGKQIKRSHDPTQGTDIYTTQKLAIESRLTDSHIPYAILRIGVSVDARTLKTDWQTFKQLLNVHPENPLEYIHPKDVSLALIHAATTPLALGKVHLIGGGLSCQITQHRFLSTAFEAAGLKLTKDMMGETSFYTHWMETTESQSILKFQHHSFDDYKNEMHHKLRVIRWLLLPIRWIINPLLNVYFQNIKINGVINNS